MKIKAGKLINELKESVYRRLKNHNSSEITFKNKILKDILYNEKSHLVANFKDFLIYDDSTEFLKRYYNKKESLVRLPKIFDFYEVNSKIFPNYIILTESRYIYKNIQRKQKLIDYLQYLEEKSKEKSEKSNKKNAKFFNSLEYDSIMKQSMFTTYENIDSESKLDVSVSVDNLIDAIDKAEKKVTTNPEENGTFSINKETGDDGSSSKNSKPTPKLNKDLKLIHFGSNNEEQLLGNMSSYKIKGLKNINSIVVEKLKSAAKERENSKTLSHSNTKFNANESIKSKEKNSNIHHTKVLSMPKLTINNNIVNNITVINNDSTGKTIASFNKNLINEIGANASTKKFDLGKNFNILNQKHTRNIKNTIAGGQTTQTQFFTKASTNTLEVAKEILNNQNKFAMKNFGKKHPQQTFDILSSNKQVAPITSRKINVNLGLEKNFQTIDATNLVIH
jgi:hypothetical protein